MRKLSLREAEKIVHQKMFCFWVRTQHSPVPYSSPIPSQKNRKGAICSVPHFESFQKHTVSRDRRRNTERVALGGASNIREAESSEPLSLWPLNIRLQKKKHSSHLCRRAGSWKAGPLLPRRGLHTQKRAIKNMALSACQRGAFGINPPRNNKLKTRILKRHTHPATASTHLSEV